MTQEQIQQLLQGIKHYADIATSVTEGFIPPQLLIPVTIGKAVIDLIPSLEQDVADMIAGRERTPAQEAETAAKLAALGNPNTL